MILGRNFVERHWRERRVVGAYWVKGGLACAKTLVSDKQLREASPREVGLGGGFVCRPSVRNVRVIG
jgi:hypothetical protein